MKRFIFLMVMLALTAALPNLGLAGYGSSGSHTNNAAAALDKLKSLEGTWTSASADGPGSTVTYHVVSNGTAVMETISNQTDADMITVFTVDGDHLMLTHYCGMGNQPRMRASVPAGDVTDLKFAFVDGGNMKKTDKHMHALHIKFVDDTHLENTWSLWDKGKLQADHTMNLTKKS